MFRSVINILSHSFPFVNTFFNFFKLFLTPGSSALGFLRSRAFLRLFALRSFLASARLFRSSAFPFQLYLDFAFLRPRLAPLPSPSLQRISLFRLFLRLLYITISTLPLSTTFFRFLRISCPHNIKASFEQPQSQLLFHIPLTTRYNPLCSPHHQYGTHLLYPQHSFLNTMSHNYKAYLQLNLKAFPY